jgi:hypothetical protein
VSQGEYFLRVLKIKSELFVIALMVFTIFGCLSAEKIVNKVSACFFEITNSENPSSNPLQEACYGFHVAACVTLKVVLKPTSDSENLFES